MSRSVWDMMPRRIDDRIILANGIGMPWLGLGVFKMADGKEVEQAVSQALKVGYRSVDTAAYYRNERGVGKAIRASGLAREEVFVTTKVWNSDQGYESTMKAFDASLERLGFDYVDLYLIHWPVPGVYRDTWKALERIYEDGRARAIGVSNFLVHHLEDLLNVCDIRPMVDQVEFHPWLVQPELLRFCHDQDILMEAWSPLIQGKFSQIPELAMIGERHDRTAAQVVLRWDIQHGVITIPKSTDPRRIEENGDIFDFELSEDEMREIDALDRNWRNGPDPNKVTF